MVSTQSARPPAERTNVLRDRRREPLPVPGGPFGKDLAGEWLDEEAARDVLVRSRSAYFERPGARPYGFWCDWHAAHYSPPARATRAR